MDDELRKRQRQEERRRKEEEERQRRREVANKARADVRRRANELQRFIHQTRRDGKDKERVLDDLQKTSQEQQESIDKSRRHLPEFLSLTQGEQSRLNDLTQERKQLKDEAEVYQQVIDKGKRCRKEVEQAAAQAVDLLSALGKAEQRYRDYMSEVDRLLATLAEAERMMREALMRTPDATEWLINRDLPFDWPPIYAPSVAELESEFRQASQQIGRNMGMIERARTSFAEQWQEVAQADDYQLHEEKLATTDLEVTKELQDARIKSKQPVTPTLIQQKASPLEKE